MSRISRRAVAVAGVLAVAPVVSACGAGKHPQTALPTQLTEGVNVKAGTVYVRNLFVLGPPPGQRLAAGGDAPVYAAIVNTGQTPDRLTEVDAPNLAAPVKVSINLPPTTLVTTNQAVTTTPTPQPGGPSATGSPIPASPSPTPSAKKPSAKKPSAKTSSAKPPRKRTPSPPPIAGVPVTEPSTLVLKNLSRALAGADSVRLVFTFERAGTLSVDVPVESMQGYYTTYSPAPTPTPTPPALARPRAQAKH